MLDAEPSTLPEKENNMTKIEEIKETISQLQQQVADLEKSKVMPEVGDL